MKETKEYFTCPRCNTQSFGQVENDESIERIEFYTNEKSTF